MASNSRVVVVGLDGASAPVASLAGARLHRPRTAGELRFTVRHEGTPLQSSVPRAEIDPGELSRSSRGLMLMGLFMDSVSINPAGTEIAGCPVVEM